MFSIIFIGMKILINEEVNKKVFGLFQRLIDEELSELKERYRNEEISASNWYLTLFSHIDKVKVINIKHKPSLSVYIDVYADAYFDEDDVQGFAQYLREKLYYAGHPWMVPILINGNLEDGIISEEQNDKLKNKLLTLIEKFGAFQAIKMIGYDKFKTFYPDYFKSKVSKIELINEIISNNEEEDYGVIRLDDIGGDILIRTENLDEGHTLEHHIDFIETDKCGVTIWEYDDKGNMDEVDFDTYTIWLEDLKTPIFNKLFEMVLNTF